MTYTVETSNGLNDCGHKHRTPRAAARCRERLYNSHVGPTGWSACAYWHAAKIVDSSGNYCAVDIDGTTYN